MLKALIWKEMRELLPIVALAAVVQCVVVATATGVRLGFLSKLLGDSSTDGSIPFVSDGSTTTMFLVVGVCCVSVGLWQSMRESWQGTFPFLLHRPLERGTILGVKLALGTVVCMLAIIAPLFYYALWAARPGTHASPFAWAMTIPCWQMCVYVPLVYFAAFLSGLRAGRWYGSRFLPLIAGLIIGAFFSLITSPATDGFWPISWFFSFVFAVAIEICFLLAIRFVAQTCDYS